MILSKQNMILPTIIQYVEGLPKNLSPTCLRSTLVSSAIAKQSNSYFHFQCPRCKGLRATVNPSNNLAHCFSCEENFNNIDLMMIQGHEFRPAVGILENWLMQYRRDLGRRTASERTVSEQFAAK